MGQTRHFNINSKDVWGAIGRGVRWRQIGHRVSDYLGETLLVVTDDLQRLDTPPRNVRFD